MQIEEIGIEVWDQLERGRRLSSEQEKLVKDHIQVGDFKDVPAIVKQLRENSRHLQQKTDQEVSKMIDNFKHFHIKAADQHLEQVITTQLEAASINAQADRIQNRADQTQARMMTVAEAMGIQYVYPERVVDAGGRSSRAARTAANQQAASQAATAAATPQRQERVGQASIDGVKTAIAAQGGQTQGISVAEAARLLASRR